MFTFDIRNPLYEANILKLYSGNKVEVDNLDFQTKMLLVTSHKKFKNYKNCLYPVKWINWGDFCKDPNLQEQGVCGIQNCNLQNIINYITKHWENYKKNNNFNPNEFDDETNQKLENIKNNLENLQNKYKDRIHHYLLEPEQMSELYKKNRFFKRLFLYYTKYSVLLMTASCCHFGRLTKYSLNP